MPSKLDFYNQKISGRAGQLREALKTLENNSPALPKQNSTAILDYLAQFDAVQSLFDELETKGGPNLASEALRFATLRERLQKRAPQLLGRLDGSAVLKAARPATATPNHAPWWFLDQEVARRRAGLMKRMAITGGVVLALVLAVIVLFNTILKPDPATLLKAQKFDRAMELATIERDFTAALTQVEEALVALPNDPEMLVFKGILLEQLSRPDEAAALFQRANQVVSEPEYLPLARGQILLRLDQADAALNAGQQAVATNPDSAEAWFLTGRAYTVLGQTGLAYNALSKGADLAFEQGDDTLYAIIKINLGYLNSAPNLEPGAVGR